MDINHFIQQLVILAPPFLFALTFHELAHGYVAWNLGDPTAKNAGRLTMNPLKHLDPLGVIAFIIMKIGWAKPVPVDPRYFKDPQKGMLLVALAGPLKGCPDLDYLGLRLNWTDYTPRERDLILSARKVLFPTIHYARQFAALGIRTYPSAASYSLLGDKAAQSLLFQMAGIPTPRTRLFTGRNRKAG